VTLSDRLHDQFVHRRRVRVLSDRLAPLIPDGARVLDVGCGDGLTAHLIKQRRPDIAIQGIDVLVRARTCIPVEGFDGKRIPFADASLDVVMFIDVLHHSDDPMILLREAARVSRRAIVIKDHMLDGFLAAGTLRFMDRVGNARYGVALPYNYWSREQWFDAWRAMGLGVAAWTTDLKLYWLPADWIFGRSLHFIARLELQ
jgi:SAM-dependent methyltransferase